MFPEFPKSNFVSYPSDVESQKTCIDFEINIDTILLAF